MNDTPVHKTLSQAGPPFWRLNYRSLRLEEKINVPAKLWNLLNLYFRL